MVAVRTDVVRDANGGYDAFLSQDEVTGGGAIAAISHTEEIVVPDFSADRANATFYYWGVPADARDIVRVSNRMGTNLHQAVRMPDDGIAARATATGVTAGVITEVTVAEAGRYALGTLAPRIVVSGGGGAGAELVARLGVVYPGDLEEGVWGVVDVDVIDGGSGYASPPEIIFETWAAPTHGGVPYKWWYSRFFVSGPSDNPFVIGYAPYA